MILLSQSPFYNNTAQHVVAYTIDTAKSTVMEFAFRCTLLVALALCAHASDVIDLKDDDFKEKVAEHEIILVEFFAPW